MCQHGINSRCCQGCHEGAKQEQPLPGGGSDMLSTWDCGAMASWQSRQLTAVWMLSAGVYVLLHAELSSLLHCLH